MIKFLKKISNENLILIMLAFYSVSVGLWNNFRQLWMETNNFNVDEISKILSFATLICVIGILFFAKKINMQNIKKFLLASLIIKSITLYVLFLMNSTGHSNIIIVLLIIDVIVERLIIVSIYPFICTIKKTDRLYSKRKLVEYLFRDIGILVGGILIGRTIYGYLVDYNICLIISIFFLICSFVILFSVKQQVVEEENKEEKVDIIKYIKSHKLIRIYLFYIISGNIAINVGLGLKMLMLTNIFNFSPSNATNYLLIVGLIADAIGILALKYFTPKDNYLTVFIKFGIRFIGYTLAFVTNNPIVCMIAITWSLLISTAYEDKVDAQYINTIPNEYQLLFTDVIYITAAISEAIGLFLAGLTYNYGVRYMLGLSAFIMLFQITFANTLVYMIKHKKEGD